jgi:hypothetical protein
MENLIGAVPPPKTDPKKERVTAGATYTWICERFSVCPPLADIEVVEKHARAYVWYVISMAMFSYDGGRTDPWMWLKVLTTRGHKT